MKEKKTTKQQEQSKEYPIKEGMISYNGIFVGLNKKGGIYVGLNKADDTKDFCGGYEALSVLNGLLNEFDAITVKYSKEVAKSGNPYEAAEVVDYKI